MAEWQRDPDETGYYWMASKVAPACRIIWYYKRDDGLTIMGGPGEGSLWIGAKRYPHFRKAFPEAMFMPFERPANPFEAEARRALGDALPTTVGDIWVGPNGEITPPGAPGSRKL